MIKFMFKDIQEYCDFMGTTIAVVTDSFRDGFLAGRALKTEEAEKGGHILVPRR